MSLVKKLKDILFEEEEYTEPIKVKETKEEDKIVKIEPKNDEIVEIPSINTTNNKNVAGPSRMQAQEITSERELFKSENTFQFPDFDEEEFQSSMARPKQNLAGINNGNYDRNRDNNKRNDYNPRNDYNSRYEKSNERDIRDSRELRDKREREERIAKELADKKKFKPSPIISPVYGILNQDYKAEDIVKKGDDASNINIEEVRKKAFEPKVSKATLPKELEFEPRFEREELKSNASTIDEPVVTFFEEKDKLEEGKEEFHSIDALLESASEEIPLENTLEIPKTNNLDAIEEELEKIDEENKEKQKEQDIEISFDDIDVDKNKDDDNDPLDDTLDSDLFELIDSMYDEREEG